MLTETILTTPTAAPLSPRGQHLCGFVSASVSTRERGTAVDVVEGSMSESHAVLIAEIVELKKQRKEMIVRSKMLSEVVICFRNIILAAKKSINPLVFAELIGRGQRALNEYEQTLTAIANAEGKEDAGGR